MTTATLTTQLRTETFGNDTDAALDITTSTFTLPTTAPKTDAELQELGDRIFLIAYGPLADTYKLRNGRNAYRFVYNRRMKTMGGWIYVGKSKPKTKKSTAERQNLIELNPHLTPTNLVDCIVHELAHGVAAAERGIANSGHTKFFYSVNNKALANLGLPGLTEAWRTHEYPELISTAEAKARRPRKQNKIAMHCADPNCRQHKPWKAAQSTFSRWSKSKRFPGCGACSAPLVPFDIERNPGQTITADDYDNLTQAAFGSDHSATIPSDRSIRLMNHNFYQHRYAKANSCNITATWTANY